MTSSNKAVVPSAREALNKFKMEAASHLGVFLPIKNDPPPDTYIADKCIYEAYAMGKGVGAMCPRQRLS